MQRDVGLGPTELQRGFGQQGGKTDQEIVRFAARQSGMRLCLSLQARDQLRELRT